MNLGTKQENLPSKELQEKIYISLGTMTRLPFMTSLPPFNVKIYNDVYNVYHLSGDVLLTIRGQSCSLLSCNHGHVLVVI